MKEIKADKYTFDGSVVRGLKFLGCVGHIDYYEAADGTIIGHMWVDYCG